MCNKGWFITKWWKLLQKSISDLSILIQDEIEEKTIEKRESFNIICQQFDYMFAKGANTHPVVTLLTLTLHEDIFSSCSRCEYQYMNNSWPGMGERVSWYFLPGGLRQNQNYSWDFSFCLPPQHVRSCFIGFRGRGREQGILAASSWTHRLIPASPQPVFRSCVVAQHRGNLPSHRDGTENPLDPIMEGGWGFPCSKTFPMI